MTGLMNAVVAHSADDYRLERVPVPQVGDGDILVKVEGCGICAGDVKATHGTARFWGGDGMPAYCEPPFIPGHEFFGRVAEVGKGVTEFREGDRIISEQIVPCGKCRYCREGRYWLCDPHNVYGFKSSLNGGMAEYALLPKGSRNYRVPESFTLEQGALIEPFACSTHAVRRSGAGVDDVVVLAGAGTLGLGMVSALAKRRPRRLIVLDMNDERLAIAKRFGADVTANPGKDDVYSLVRSETEGYGCDIYIEATGFHGSVNQGLEMIRKGGTFVEFSVMGSMTTCDWSIIGDAKEITILGSQLSPYCYPASIAGIADGSYRTDGVVTDVFPLEEFAAAYAAAQNGRSIKVVLRP